MEYKHIDGVRVEVDDVVYMPSLQSPPDKPHPYVYFVTIYNDSDQEIQVLGRKWVVDELGHDCTVLEGDGVVGATPILPPGDKFTYNSYHVIGHSAEVAGAFYGKTSDGEPFSVIIPEFDLQVP